MIKRIFTALILLALVCFTLAGCGGKTVNLAEVDSDELQFKGVKSGDTVATIKTDEGDIKVVLYPDLAPLAVHNFITHAENGYFDGVAFHRVVEDFIIQTGMADEKGGNSIWGLPFSDEYSELLHHYSGALCMANDGDETSNRSQFYIVTSLPEGINDEVTDMMEDAGWRSEVIETYRQAGGIPQQDYRDTVFGQVYEGLDVAFKINGVKTDGNDMPRDEITIQSITVETVE